MDEWLNSVILLLLFVASIIVIFSLPASLQSPAHFVIPILIFLAFLWSLGIK